MPRRQQIAVAWIAVVIALLAIHVLAPQRSGVIALTEVFEPYILLTGLIAALFALKPRRRVAVLVVALLLVATLGRYGPVWISFPQRVQSETIAVAAWNMEAGPNAGQRAIQGLGNTDAAIVGIEELQPEGADALATDPSVAARFPFQVLAPDDDTLGVGLISRYPIVSHDSLSDPPMIRAVVTAPDGQQLSVIVFHPSPANFESVLGVPIGLDTQFRDEAISRIRSVVNQELAAHRPVVLLGDLNTTEREPAYAKLTDGLRDAHLDAGLGPGFSWRPQAVSFLPFGLLRIDYIFATPNLPAISSVLDCSVPSDHCRVEANFALSNPG